MRVQSPGSAVVGPRATASAIDKAGRQSAEAAAISGHALRGAAARRKSGKPAQMPKHPHIYRFDAMGNPGLCRYCGARPPAAA